MLRKLITAHHFQTFSLHLKWIDNHCVSNCCDLHPCFDTLTCGPVSQTLWPQEDSFPGVCRDDNFRLPSLRPGRRHQTIGWVTPMWSTTKTDAVPETTAFLGFSVNAFFALAAGIMSILFSGIVMSHYTHHNLSPVTQILMQQTLRSVAFMCGESPWGHLQSGGEPEH